MSRDFAAVNALVGQNYDLVGELGRRDDGVQAFLARERSTNELVAVRVETSEGKAPDISVARTLNSNVPATHRSCPICKSAVQDWRRFCYYCGTDLTGIDLRTREEMQGQILEEAVKASSTPVDLIGHMRLAEGGGAVYFGRDRNTGGVLALDLRKQPTNGDPPEIYALTISAILRTPQVSPAQPSGPTPAPASTIGSTVSSSDAGAGPTAVKYCPACGKEFESAIRFCPDDGSVLRPRTQQDDLIGEIIADRYHVIRKIGQGGMGAVYLAEHVRMGRRCAIKVMKRSLSQDVGAVSRFAREAANASRINDDNVAHIYDFGETKEHGIYIAMEYVEGETLSKLIAREGRLPPARAVGIAIQIANGLAAAHNEGVIHRDLTPSNVITGRGREQNELVKVVDFGIAKTMQDTSGPTRTGFIVGTPQYMSPEQIIADPLDGRSDIYSLGCILYEMLTGTQPFGAFAGPEQLTRRLTEPPPRPRAKVPDLPHAIDAVVVKAMARKSAERFQTASEFRDALIAAAVEAEKSARRFSWLRRRPGASPEDAARRGLSITPATPAPAGTPRSVPPISTPARAKPGSGEAFAATTPQAAIPSQSAPRTQPPAPSTPTPVQSGTPLTTPASSTAGSRATEDLPGWSDSAPDVFTDEEAAPPGIRAHRRWLVAGALAVVLAGVAYGVWRAADRASTSPTVDPPISAIGEDPPPVAVTGNPDSAETVAGTRGNTGVTPVTVQTDTTPPPPSPGRLRLGALPGGAIVRVDGQRVTPVSNTVELSPGSHTIEISAAGFTTVRRRLSVAPGQQVPWAPTLARVPVAPPVAAPESTPVRTRPTPPADTAREPQTFDASAIRQINRFTQAIEARNMEYIRLRTTAQLASEIASWLNQAGDSPVRAAVRNVAPDSTGLKASFLLRIIAGNRDILPFADFQASFVKVPGGWRLLTLDRR